MSERAARNQRAMWKRALVASTLAAATIAKTIATVTSAESSARLSLFRKKAFMMPRDYVDGFSSQSHACRIGIRDRMSMAAINKK
jgi:hypothetical protein